ncbi:hypothetical protein H8S37_04300 [Mediterraneibacter sp. NSJ-55]|uniref:Uncharacterized protein n=1 Tax=Mediterraneibacter hominis TaxID=2763054 RepID=A0A923RP56_9FIRM|nr:hypothetical protein [Mediterraneibacter hominis]MBC5688154.1 hypothetical protein [Mediterraneibacter hominis]
MERSWHYFIVLNDKERLGSLVEDAEVPEDGLPICVDLNVAISFPTPEELNEWVKDNTSLSLSAGDYHIEGHYL